MYNSLPVFLISLVIEVLKLIIIMSGIFSFSFARDKKNYIGFLGAACVITAVLYRFDFMNPLTLPLTAMIMTAFVITGKKKNIYIILSEVTASCVDEGVNYFVVKVNWSQNVDYYVISNAFGMVIFSLVAYFIQSRRKRGFDYSVKRMNVFYLIMLILAQCVIMYYTSALHGKNAFNRMVLFIIIAVVLFVELAMIYTLNQKEYYLNTSMINKKMLDTQEKYYLTLLDHESEIKKFRHDVKNHLLSLEALIKEGKNEEAVGYISELKGSFALNSPEIRTGNTIVSAIASDYVSKFPDAELEWNGLIPDELKISSVDVCTIFSNVLGNAFESAVKSETDKKVNVVIETVTNSMIITVRNSIGEPVVEKDGIFETSKEDKTNHGLGTQNIRSCVKSNSGEVEFNFDDKIFEVRIILPNALQVF